MTKKKIGFIGTGVMGTSIVKHLLSAGYEVQIYSRTKSKASELIELGAKWQNTPAGVTENAEVIFTIVGYPSDVEEVYYGENGIFKTATKRHILIDMTTSTPTLANRIYQTGIEKGIAVLDAPVSGGDEPVFDSVKPILEEFSGKLNLQGSAGSGQHTKMANQIMVAGTMTGMTELLVYAKAAGLDIEKVLDTVGGGSAQNWSLSNYGPRILKEDYSAGFFIKHFVKDLKIVLDEAKRMNLNLPATALAEKLYEELEGKGNGNDGTQALIKLWWEN